MKIVSNGPSVNGEARSILEAAMTSSAVKWPDFQKALDDYRDAAWKDGYNTAKSEMLDKVKGNP